MTTIDIDRSKIEGLGVSEWQDIGAFRTEQGKHTRYTFTAPIGYLTRAVKRPDPAKPFPQNRKVEKARAKRFGDYLREAAAKRESWTFPPIQLRAMQNSIRNEQVIHEGMGFVGMQVPRFSSWDIQDGQHRILGVYMFEEDTAARIAALHAEMAKAERKGDRGAIKTIQNEIAGIEKIRATILEGSMVEIVLVVADDQTHSQMFADIAINAKGINPDFAATLDMRDPVHRIAENIIETCPPLNGLISSGQSGRMSTSSPELLGAKGVANICHAVIVGTGRVGKNMHSRIEDDEELWRERVREFINAMFESFPDLQMLSKKEIDAPALRERSLIASASMWRSLAIAWHLVLYEEDRLTVGKAKEFFRELEPHLRCFKTVETPDTRTGELVKKVGMPENHWLWGPTGKFRVGNRTPEGRHSDINDLGRILAGWARNGIPSREG